MTLKINKACDLSSISVFPPARRANAAASGANPSLPPPRSNSQPPSQLRSQSQLSSSQGMPLSQLSQTSFDERLDSQERDQSCRRISSIVPLRRDDSEMQLTRSSNNGMRRWNSAPGPAPENKCAVNEEIEHRLGLMHTSLARLGKLLDSVQSDVMQVNRAVREVMLETECIRQKIHFQDSFLQTVLKKEEDIKESLDRSLRSASERVKNEAEQNKLKEISSALSALPDKIVTRILKFQNELYGDFLREMKETVRSRKEPEAKNKELLSAPPLENVAPHLQSFQPSQMPMKSHSITKYPGSHSVKKEDCSVSKGPTPLFQNKKGQGQKNTVLPTTKREKGFIITIESDGEIDRGCSFSANKKSDEDMYLIEEAKEETMRILRKARRRKRKLDNTILLD